MCLQNELNAMLAFQNAFEILNFSYSQNAALAYFERELHLLFRNRISKYHAVKITKYLEVKVS